MFIESNDPDLSLPFYKKKMIAVDGTIPREAAGEAADERMLGCGEEP